MKHVKQTIISWLRRQLDKIGNQIIDSKTDDEINEIIKQIKLKK